MFTERLKLPKTFTNKNNGKTDNFSIRSGDCHKTSINPSSLRNPALSMVNLTARQTLPCHDWMMGFLLLL